MITYHLQPPPAQRAGGLDAAIRGLCGALEKAGVPARLTLPAQLESDAVVHLHGLWQRPFLAAARQCRAQGIPYVVSPHGMLEPWAWRHKWWKKWPYFQLVEKGLLRGAAALLATAEDEASRLRARLPGQRVEALPLGLTGDAGADYDTARAHLGWAPGERVLLFLSRLHVKKGVELLLSALAEIAPPATRLVIVGDGEPSYVAALQALARRLPHVDWIGPVWGEARWPYFQGADLFCLPTHSENFGLAVLEALQVGTPVLTTRMTPWGSTLTEPEGFICDPTVDDVTATLRRALQHPPLSASARETLSQRTHSRYGWGQLASAYVQFYESLS